MTALQLLRRSDDPVCRPATTLGIDLRFRDMYSLFGTRDFVRIVNDQHCNLPVTVRVVQHVGDTYALQLLPVDRVPQRHAGN
jgi:hypothetical protein